MKNSMNNFDNSNICIGGEYQKDIICFNCKHRNVANIKQKFSYIKISTIICKNCGQAIRLGDIFNFETGQKLNKRLENHNQQLYDDYVWDNTHSKIK